MAKKKELAFRKKKKNRTSIYIAIMVVTLFCGYLYIRGISLRHEKEMLQAEVNQLQEQKEGEEQRRQELEEFETFTHTKKYAEQLAKDILGYVYEDEIVFKPEE